MRNPATRATLLPARIHRTDAGLPCVSELTAAARLTAEAGHAKASEPLDLRPCRQPPPRRPWRLPPVLATLLAHCHPRPPRPDRSSRPRHGDRHRGPGGSRPRRLSGADGPDALVRRPRRPPSSRALRGVQPAAKRPGVPAAEATDRPHTTSATGPPAQPWWNGQHPATRTRHRPRRTTGTCPTPPFASSRGDREGKSRRRRLSLVVEILDGEGRLRRDRRRLGGTGLSGCRNEKRGGPEGPPLLMSS